MARGSTPETTANVAIAITQRFQDATDFTAYHTDYDVWATNNHTQLGFQMNLTCPMGEGLCKDGTMCQSHMDNQWWSSAAAFRLHFPYVSSLQNTKLFMKALGHTFSWLGSSWLPTGWYFGKKEMFVGYCFGDIAPNVPMSFGPFSLPTMFGMLPMPGMMPMPMKAEFRAGAAGYIKSSPASVSFPIIILQEAVLSVDKQDAYLALFQKKADQAYKSGVYAFYCTTTAPSIAPFGLTDPYKRKAGWHMEKLVNLCAPLSHTIRPP